MEKIKLDKETNHEYTFHIMTVNEQAAKFLIDSLTRRRSPVKAATARAYQSHITKWIGPYLGLVPISVVQNGHAKMFISHLHEAGLKPASINAIFMTLKLIVASAVSSEGDQLYKVTWNQDFIGLPVIVPAEQDAPTLSVNALQNAIRRAQGADKALYALLAGSGLRIGEALALRVGLGPAPTDFRFDSYWYPKACKLSVRSTVSGGRIQPSTKTAAGVREVDLHPDLNDYLSANLYNRKHSDLLFRSESGGLTCVKTAYQRLAKAGIMEGFHAFRRFRVTHLRSQGVPEDLIQYWIGHAKAGITDRYSKMSQDLKIRTDWATVAGLGFELGGK